jgi:CubicO group peptidase (beta-lactamase class C family)
MGAAIFIDGKLAWTKGYGYADKQARRPFTPDTVINIGSVTKTFTGVAIMQAVQDGKLSLDADINDYLPFKVVNPHFPAERITLRQLATHSSGISDRWSVYRDTYHYGGDSPQDLGEFLRGYFVPGGADYSPDNFLAHKPGSYEEYSNIGAGLAGYIVERATGRKLADFTRERIFAPLGMSNSGWSIGDIARDRLSTLYVSQDTLTAPIPLYGATTYPDGGIRTSVADLSRFFEAMLGDGANAQGRILSPAALAELERFQFDAAHKPENLDLTEENSGIFWQTKFNATRVGHGGSDPGIKVEMLCSLDRRIGIILFSNTSLAGEDMKHYLAVLKGLWKQAEAMRTPTSGD